MEVKAKAVIVTTGCRERTREMIRIPGSRPAGLYTAGCAQNLINLLGYMVGKKIVILGSGDIGLIMARRLTLEGAEVPAVFKRPKPQHSTVPRRLWDTTVPEAHGRGSQG